MTKKPGYIAVLTTFITLASLGVNTSANEALSKNEMQASGKGAALFATAAVAGAIAAGPIGMFVGALGGAFISEDLKRGARKEDSLVATEKTIATYKARLLESESKVAQLQQATAERLEFQVMFMTGEDTLAHQDIQRINSLAGYLKQNPELKIRLDAHTDPRGTDEYNNLLSQERALAVVNALEARGISPERISYVAHGAALSTAYQGDLEAYALERKVKIEVYLDESSVALN